MHCANSGLIPHKCTYASVAIHEHDEIDLRGENKLTTRTFSYNCRRVRPWRLNTLCLQIGAITNRDDVLSSDYSDPIKLRKRALIRITRQILNSVWLNAITRLHLQACSNSMHDWERCRKCWSVCRRNARPQCARRCFHETERFVREFGSPSLSTWYSARRMLVCQTS